MKFSFFDRIVHKIGEITIPLLSSIRQKKLNNTDFTIISNNCWAGICYEYYGLPKNSPTVGLYFFADEYIKFISNIEHYLGCELKIVTAHESKYEDELIRRGQGDILVGVLDDVEMTLLHYHDKQTAIDKWKRRIKRVNWDNIIFKFSYMNLCNEEHIEKFEEIISQKKKNKRKGQKIKSILFLPYKQSRYSDAYYVEPAENGQIDNDTFYWNRYCNVLDIINS